MRQMVFDDMGDRTPLSEVQVDDELWGEVTKVSNYGAFIDCGVEVDGFLHVMYYPKKPRVSVGHRLGDKGRPWPLRV